MPSSLTKQRENNETKIAFSETVENTEPNSWTTKTLRSSFVKFSVIGSFCLMATSYIIWESGQVQDKTVEFPEREPVDFLKESHLI